MHDLIASYLFQNKSCPLPGLGNLSVMSTEAKTDFGNSVIIAPDTSIQFVAGETDTHALLNYLSNKTNTGKDEVAAELDNFCVRLKNDATQHSTASLDGVGNFFVDNNGEINFVPNELPPAFAQPVPAIRVIHPSAEHNILVGDKETTNFEMTEYFNEEAPAKDRWWIWAIVLGAIAATIVLLYLNDKNSSAEFGNAIKILSLP